MSSNSKTLLIGMPIGTPLGDVEHISRTLGQHFPEHDVVVVAGLQYAKVVENT